MKKIYGYARQKSYALDSIKKGSLSHFYIISGEKFCGKKSFVDFFVRAILCENNNGCGKCRSCSKFESGNSVDVLRVKGSNKKSIGAKDIRAIIDDIYIRPIDTRYKIYIIDEGENLTLEASNTLLKIFEEPPDYAIFFLLTSNKEKIIDTISSRATYIYLPPIDYGIVGEYIKNELKIFDEKKLDFLVRYSFGNIGVVEKIAKDEEFFALREELIRLLEIAGAKDARLMNMVKILIEENKEKTDEIFRILVSFIRDVSVFKTCGSDELLINTDKKYVIKSLSEKIDGHIELYNGIIEAIKLKDRSVNTQMTLKMAFMTCLSEEKDDSYWN